MISRNYLLDWILMLHAVFRFSAVTLNLAVKNLDDYMQTHLYRDNIPNEKVAYIILLLSCMDCQEPDMNGFLFRVKKLYV